MTEYHSENLYNFNEYYKEIREIYTDQPIDQNILSKPICSQNIDNEKSSLFFYKNKYYLEWEFYRLIYVEYCKMLAKPKTKIERNRVKEFFGDLYNELLDICNEYNVSENKIKEFLNLPLDKDLVKFKRNITKKFNKLCAMKDIKDKNKDQIDSLRNYNLVKFKKKWIESQITI